MNLISRVSMPTEEGLVRRVWENEKAIL